jgi:hypothetical protein
MTFSSNTTKTAPKTVAYLRVSTIDQDIEKNKLTVRPFFSEFPKFQYIEFLGLIRLPNLGGKLTANLPPRL